MRSAKFTYVDLPKGMSEKEIIDQYLGGKENAIKNAVTEAQVHQVLLRHQMRGETGDLVHGDRANVFFLSWSDGATYPHCEGLVWGGSWTGYPFGYGEFGWRKGDRLFVAEVEEIPRSAFQTPYEPLPVSERSKKLAALVRGFSEELKKKTVIANGRLYTTVTGVHFSGSKWIKHFSSDIDENVKELLRNPSYMEKSHYLEAGKEFRVALVFGWEIPNKHERTMANMEAIARSEFGEQVVNETKGELAPLLFRRFSSSDMEALGLGRIIVPHQAIVLQSGQPRMLGSICERGNSHKMRPYTDDPEMLEVAEEVFAFIVP